MASFIYAMPSLQETLNTVVTYLRNGGKRSLEGVRCSFRGDGGAKCFVGLVIPDDVVKFVGSTASAPELRVCCDMSATDVDALCGLQDIHDNYNNWHWHTSPVTSKFNETGWAALRKWATMHNLSWPEAA